jgi:hypothetical protein
VPQEEYLLHEAAVPAIIIIIIIIIMTSVISASLCKKNLLKLSKQPPVHGEIFGKLYKYNLHLQLCCPHDCSGQDILFVSHFFMLFL